MPDAGSDVALNKRGLRVFPTAFRQKAPVCVDLFSGAGGFSLAALQAGFVVAAAVEINPHACVTYHHNLVSPLEGKEAPRLIQGDILKSDVGTELQDAVRRTERSCDVVLGGPPCQGFSVHRIKGAGIDDPRNALLLRYFELVEALSPKAFLMENVPGILWPRHQSWLRQFYERGEKAGYRVFAPEILDARNYGVPQRRRRVFVLGIREDIHPNNLAWPPSPTHAAPDSKPEGVKAWKSARAVFEKQFPASDPNDIHMRHSEALQEVFRNTPLDGGNRHQSGRVLPCHLNHDGHMDVYGRIRLDEPGPTMTTACINPSKGRFVHPTEHHGITVRQAARFQTFPDDFVFEGGLMAAGAQIGNAVPVRLGKVLLSHLAKMLNLQATPIEEDDA